MQTRLEKLDGDSYRTVVTFENDDQAIVYSEPERNTVTISTDGGGYNGAIRMTADEANAFAELVALS
jgi:hypothetical protein